MSQAAAVLRPSPVKLLLFLCFAFLWVAGVIQSYAFIDDVPGVEKPPLYDLLRPFDFWFPWVIFSAPLHLFSSFLCSLRDFCSTLFSTFPGMGAARFPVIGVIYSYLASSWMVYSWSRWLTTPFSRRLTLTIPILPTLLLTGFPTIIPPSAAAFILSSIPLIYLISTFYTISFYGLCKAAASTFKLIWRGVAGRKRHA